MNSCADFIMTDIETKRKRTILALKGKLNIIKMIDKSVSYSVIAETFGIGMSTVGDIKKQKEKIQQFGNEIAEMGMTRKAKTMKLGKVKKLIQAVYMWFKQRRMKGEPFSGPLLCEKAVELSEILHGKTSFKASHG